jgi:hypothetical protein
MAKARREIEYVEASSKLIPWAARNAFPREFQLSRGLADVTMNESGNIETGQSQEKWRVEIGDCVDMVYIGKKIMAPKHDKPEDLVITMNPIIVVAGFDPKTGFVHGVNLRLMKHYKDTQTLTEILFRLRQHYYEQPASPQDPWIPKPDDFKPKWSGSQSFRYDNFTSAYNMSMRLLPQYYRVYNQDKIYKPTIINIEEAEMKVMTGSFTLLDGSL